MSQVHINLAVVSILGTSLAAGLVSASGNVPAQLAVLGFGSVMGMEVWRSTKSEQ